MAPTKPLETQTERVFRERIEALEARLAGLETATGLFASDKDIDSANGDPTVKWPPKSWRGPSFEGKKFSECSPEFLDAFAEYLTWKADNPKASPKPGQTQQDAEADAQKYAKFNRADARKARSWARRIRSGWQAPESTAGEFPGDAPSAGGFEAPAFAPPPAFDAKPFDAGADAPFADDDPDLPF